MQAIAEPLTLPYEPADAPDVARLTVFAALPSNVVPEFSDSPVIKVSALFVVPPPPPPLTAAQLSAPPVVLVNA